MEQSVRAPRRARLYVTRLNPWSVAKASFMLAVVLAIVTVVALLLLWGIVSVLGIFDAITRNVTDLVGSAAGTFDLGSLFSFGNVLGVALVIASVEIVLVSVLATLFAVLYNLTVSLTGGIEVVLSDDY